MRIAFLTAALLVLLDQGAKIWVRMHIDSYQIIPLLPRFSGIDACTKQRGEFQFHGRLAGKHSPSSFAFHFYNRGGGNVVFSHRVLEIE